MSDEERAELVAYLDGELDEAAAQSLEARLSRDPDARAEADALKKTWDLLDYLPRPEPSANFTHRTLEKLAVKDLTTGTQTRPPRRWRWLAPVGWAAAMLIALGGGLFAAHHLWPRPNPAPPPGPDTAEVEEQLAKHLRVLENKRLYDPVDDLEFLRALDQPDLFGDDEFGS